MSCARKHRTNNLQPDSDGRASKWEYKECLANCTFKMIRFGGAVKWCEMRTYDSLTHTHTHALLKQRHTYLYPFLTLCKFCFIKLWLIDRDFMYRFCAGNALHRLLSLFICYSILLFFCACSRARARSFWVWLSVCVRERWFLFSILFNFKMQTSILEKSGVYQFTLAVLCCLPCVYRLCIHTHTRTNWTHHTFVCCRMLFDIF